MHHELEQYINDNIYSLAHDFTNTNQEAKYLIEDWEIDQLADHPLEEDFIAYCEEGLSDAIEGERAKQDSL